MKRLRAFLPLLLLLLIGLWLFGSGALDDLKPSQLLAHQDQLRQTLDKHPWSSRLAYIGLLTLAVATGLPGNMMIIMAGGFAFGILIGTLCSSAGLVLGSLILFFASRYAFGHGQRQAPSAVARLKHGFTRHPITYTLFLRLVPVLPFGVITVSLAWLGCPLWLFLSASWLGGSLTALLENAMGAGIGHALSEEQGPGLAGYLHAEVLWPLLAIAALALLPLLLRRWQARRKHPQR